MSPTALVWTFSYALAFLYFAFRVVVGDYNLYNFGAAVALLVLLVYAYIRSVRRYMVDNSNIVVVRSGPGRIQIPLAAVISAQFQPDLGAFYNPSFLTIGGVFGWASRVQVRKSSDLTSTQATAYGTNARNSVLLTMDDERLIILTPADPAGFVAAVQKAGAGPAPSVIKPATASRRKSGHK